MTLHLQSLKNEDLKQVLLQRSRNLHFPLSDAIIEFLTETFQSNKALHMALNALVLRSHQQTPTLYRLSLKL